MAVGSISTTNGTGSSTAGVAATATITASVGDTLIVVAGSDDRASSEAMLSTAVTDSAGNTWTRLLTQQNADATANNHCALAIFGTVVTNALTGGTVTLTPQSNVPVKDFTLYRFTGLSLTIRGSNQGAVTASTPAALASSSPLSGDLVVGATVLEGPTSDTWTADSDTTNGSWSANATDGTTGGTATNNISIRSQFKIVNANGTQTYNGANSVSRDMSRGILVLAPTPPPASAPAPPGYVPQYSRTTSTGMARVSSGVIDTYSIGANFDPLLPPLIYSVGAGSSADEAAGMTLPAALSVVQALTDLGFAVVTPSTVHTYGNSTAMTRIGEAITYARTTFGCSTKPIAMLGVSEGACDSMTYAYNNPTLVACIASLIPIIDLAEMVEQDTLGLAASVLSAWGVGALPLPAGADPMTAGHQATLAQIPMQHWYSTDDAVSANITAFQVGTGCDVRAVGPFGHSNTAMALAWPTHIAEFIRKRVGVPYREPLF